MAANRKLLAEIQQVLKKVEEGILVFDEVWEKVYSAQGQALKEKYEGDLKKEIKKLQRLRDQIKAWISSNEVKDKNDLIEARKTIESKMEQFKICEKDTKTKAFSKEGLAREAKLDPKEALKEEKRAWLNECLEKLADIINNDEADKEKLLAVKGGKTKNKDQLGKFDNRLLKHRWHETRLELIMKLVENDDLDPALLEGIKDSVEFYLESAADDEGSTNPEDEFDIYEDLELDSIVPESELEVDVAKKGGKGKGDDEEVSPTKEEVEKAAASAAASAAPVSAVKIPAGTKGAGAPVLPTGKAVPPALAPAKGATPAAAAASAKGTAAAPAATPAAAPASAAAAKPTPAAAAPAAKAEKKSMAAMLAASVEAEKEKEPEQPSGPVPTPVVVPAPVNPTPGLSWATAAAAKTSAANAAAAAAATPVTPAAVPEKATPPPPSLVAATPAAAAAVAAAASATPGPPSLVKPVPPTPPTASLPTPQPAPPALSLRSDASVASAGSSSTAPAAPHSTGSVPGTPLLGSASPALGPASTPVAMPPPLQQKVSPEMLFTLNMLKASMLLTPESLEPEKAPGYTPRNFYQHTHASFPSTPLFTAQADNAAFFERLPMDALFFVFYFQQGTYQQYLAAKQLKKHSWRFHKKYMTWFQRHEEPKIATDEYEEGTYVYFDYESGWCQRIKSEFKFEYAYLEDELSSNMD